MPMLYVGDCAVPPWSQEPASAWLVCVRGHEMDDARDLRDRAVLSVGKVTRQSKRKRPSVLSHARSIIVQF